MINRKAKHNYHILEEYRTGIVLTGSEVKSIKANEMSVSDIKKLRLILLQIL